MLKYARFDIEDGLNSMKIGIINIIFKLVTNQIKEFIIPVKVSIPILGSILDELYKSIKVIHVDSSSIEFILENKHLKILVEDHKTIFKLV